MIVRYAAFFDADFSENKHVFELCLSYIALEKNVAPYTDVEVVLYTLEAYKEAQKRLAAQFRFKSRIIALDSEHADFYRDAQDFANSLKNLTAVDRYCVVRMLADFTLLDPTAYRLLVGADTFFLRQPHELFSFVWSHENAGKVLYARDLTTFGGQPYKLRHYRAPILEGLLGDFYCLAPEIRLDPCDIKNCLRLIDSWPTSESRFIPAYDDLSVTVPEQQAAAILLASFEGVVLPSALYSHLWSNSETTLLHTHNLGQVLGHMGKDVEMRLRELAQKPAPRKKSQNDSAPPT